VPPATHYARSGDVSIAYSVHGDGPIDAIVVPPFLSHLDHHWEEPRFARWAERFESFARVISFDKRGTGLSDPITGAPTLEERMDDVRAVMDAAESERAAVLGFSEGGAMSMLFAATYPDRTTALVLTGSFAKGMKTDDYDPGFTQEQADFMINEFLPVWGTGASIAVGAPSVAGDERSREWWARYERLSASPGTALALVRMALETDVRAVLPTIRVPTLVLHRADDAWIPAAAGRYIADHIPGARYVELEGQDNTPWIGDQDSIVEEIEEFLTGVRRHRKPDRVLATIMFTDIVSSTERAAKLGDRAWRDLLGTHDEVMRRQLERFQGRPVKTLGDGFLATFDGPARAIHCARAAVDSVRELGVEIRAGLHTGEVEVMGDDVGGMAVHIAARVGAKAEAGEVLVSSTVRDLVVGSRIEFDERGSHELKGVPDAWRLYAVQR
jgi:class 3 adenylate cyclase/esterase/lipase